MIAGHVVLDASAVRAFVRGSLAVGELLVILGEDASIAVLPAAAMAQAFSDAEHAAMLRYILGHPRTEVAPLDGSNVEEVGRLSELPSLGHAHAAVAARRLKSFLMTEEPDVFAGLVDKEMLIEI